MIGCISSMKSEAVPSSTDALREIIWMERLCGISSIFILWSKFDTLSPSMFWKG